MIIEFAIVIVLVIIAITEFIKWGYPNSVYLIRGERCRKREAFDEKEMVKYNRSDQTYILRR